MRSFVLLSSATLASAHVRGKYTGFPIRNANSPSADGGFSVSGPCGGSAAWGANGMAELTEGQEITLNIAYNGGHQSNTENFFQLAFACGGQDGQDHLQLEQVSTTFGTPSAANSVLIDTATISSPTLVTIPEGGHPNSGMQGVDATASSTAGYDITFIVPAPMDIADGTKCTFAAVEGRNWGMCVDAQITALPAGATPPEVPQTTISGKDLSSAFSITENHCIRDTANCVCLDGEAAIEHARSATTGSATLNLMSGYAATSLVEESGNLVGSVVMDKGTSFEGLPSTTTTNQLAISVVYVPGQTESAHDVYLNIANVDTTVDGGTATDVGSNPGFCSAEMTVAVQRSVYDSSVVAAMSASAAFMAAWAM